MKDVVALLEGTYDIHTHFKYTFQDKGYKNLMREKSFEKEGTKKPDLEKIRVK